MLTAFWGEVSIELDTSYGVYIMLLMMLITVSFSEVTVTSFVDMLKMMPPLMIV